MLKNCLSLFERNCPCCGKVVPWSTRLKLLEQQHIRCDKCQAHLAIQRRDKVVNSGLFTLFYIFYLSTFHVELISFNALMTFFIFVEMCRAFNLLFSFVRINPNLKRSRTTK